MNRLRIILHEDNMTSAEVIAGLVRRHLAGETLDPVGGRRCIAEIWQTNRGFVFADIGWPTNDSGHPFHRVDGTATAGEGGDVVTALDDRRGMVARVYPVRPDAGSDDPTARDAARWQAYLASPEGKRYPGRKGGLAGSRSIDPTARL